MYFTFSIIQFKNNIRKKVNIFTGIMENLLSFLVYLYIFKALFRYRPDVDGYTLQMVITSILFIECLSHAYYNYEFVLQKKLKEGALLTELLKPVDFEKRALFTGIGNLLFKLCFHAAVVLLISIIITDFMGIDILKPKGIIYFVGSILSMIIGYFIYWYIDFIINELIFFDLSVWSFSTIKNGIIYIFGGELLPIWFMPEIIQDILKLTPLPYIYQIPVNIYLGLYSYNEIIYFILVQILWVTFLYLISRLAWNKGIKKLLQKGV